MRRANSLVGFWAAGEFVIENYLVRRRAAVTPALLQFVNDHPGPLPAAKLVASLAAALTGPTAGQPEAAPAGSEIAAQVVSGLLATGVYLHVDGDSGALDGAVAAKWRWGEPARWFHFGTRDTPFEPDIEVQRQWLVDLAAAEPPPPPTLSLAGPRVPLPAAEPLEGPDAALGEVLDRRRTVRHWDAGPISAAQLATVLGWTWGTSRYVEVSPIGPYQLRRSPSGGSRHSVEVFVAAAAVVDVPSGLYHYDTRDHALTELRRFERRELSGRVKAWFAGQPWPASAAAVFVMVSFVERSMWKYRHPHAYRVVLLDAGHLGQTFHLVATALRLGSFTSTGLSESAIEADFGLDGVTALPVYAAALGRPRTLTGPGRDGM